MHFGQQGRVEGCHTSSGSAVGLLCRYRAATPDTGGQAMEVPEAVMVAVSLVSIALSTDTPGAYKSTQSP